MREFGLDRQVQAITYTLMMQLRSKQGTQSQDIHAVHSRMNFLEKVVSAHADLNQGCFPVHQRFPAPL